MWNLLYKLCLCFVIFETHSEDSRSSLCRLVRKDPFLHLTLKLKKAKERKKGFSEQRRNRMKMNEGVFLFKEFV